MSRPDHPIAIRTDQQLDLMRRSGQISAVALKKVIQNSNPGVSLEQLEAIAVESIESQGGECAFKRVPGYHWATCLTINQEVVHGIPRPIVLKKGDVLNIDLGAYYQGWYSDTAWTVIVGGQEGQDSRKIKFVQIGERTLWKALDQAVEGSHIGDISHAIQTGVEAGGFSVVRTLIGHGVGSELHESPEIPGVGRPGTGPRLQSGMTLAIEVIYTSGAPEVVVASDGWTVETADGSLGGLYEMSVIVGKKAPEVLTDWRDA